MVSSYRRGQNEEIARWEETRKQIETFGLAHVKISILQLLIAPTYILLAIAEQEAIDLILRTGAEYRYTENQLV